MSELDFFRRQSKERTAASVKVLEAQTSAEVVVAVRRRSGDYRATAYHFGFAAAGVVVAYMWVVPQVFTPGAMALEALGAFALCALLGCHVKSLARLLVGRRRLRANTGAAARAAFYELGISRTTGRNGILVFVSTFEQSCAVLPDIGIEVTRLGSRWSEGCDAMDAAVRNGRLSAFLAALESLGPVLGEAMPRAENDVNELPDEVQ
jgi:putative membrane protein